MSSEIVHGVDTMALAERAWHGYGTVVGRNMTYNEALGVAGLDWTARLAPLTAITPTGVREIDTHRATYRSDTGTVLGVVGADYQPHQPAELLELARLTLDAAADDGHVEVIGSLRGGRTVFITIALPGEVTIAGVEDITEARLNRMFTTNVNSAFLCAREAVRRMSTARGGRGGAIVTVSSAAARIGSPNEYVHYAASKAAVDAMTVGLAKEVAEEGIRVNAVRPGVIHTSLHAMGGEPGRVERVKATVPMKRGGQPEEIAGAILWLLSDEASYVTGSILDVSGGR